MRVGYCVPINWQLASFRLRVAIPAKHLGCDYVIGEPGNPSFFFKNGDVALASRLRGVVYDVVNDHFHGAQARDYTGMCAVADVVTCASEVMAEKIRDATGIDATVIDDPYENAEAVPACDGDQVLWFGHAANAGSLRPYANLASLVICSNLPGAVWWTRDSEAKCLSECAVVLMTGSNEGASSNRIVKAIRAGRFVVTPGGIPSWEQFKDFIWLGDVHKGIEWALNNRDEACQKVKAGQEWVRERFSPSTIGKQWASLFGSI